MMSKRVIAMNLQSCTMHSCVVYFQSTYTVDGYFHIASIYKPDNKCLKKICVLPELTHLINSNTDVLMYTHDNFLLEMNINLFTT